MHIVQFCPTTYAIPPKGYGGTERVVYWLARAHHLAGHRVTVIAHPASAIADELPGVQFIAWTGEQTLESLLPADADVVHIHKVPQGFQGLTQPFLVTEHGNRPAEVQLQVNTVFVSASHARVHGRSTFVPNGVPLIDYRLGESKKRSMLSLVRMEWPHKNARTAIDLALDLDLPLDMAGKYPPWLRPKIWGPWCLQPLAVSRLVTRLGYVGGQRKLDLLAEAAVSFHLVNWHEPAAISVLESLASGTPVLGSPNGSVPDYVEHGATGMIVSSYEEALDAARTLSSLDSNEQRAWSRRCRDSAVTFDSTSQGYLRIYERVVAGETLSMPDERRPAQERPVVIIKKPW